jgi:FtsP/CotA-like multicopper oxidase with cupredoxin domain
MDGVTDVTQDPVKPGADFVYEFTAQSTPAVGMYHSHHNAVEQVPDGLAGAFLIGEQPVPAGVTVSQQQVMILDDSGTIGYALNGKSFPATAPIAAALGDWVEVQYMNEGSQIHPMHLHGMAQMVIAKDGYPLANPQLEDTITVAPGERYTVLVHATEPGVWVWHCHILPHAENDQGMFGMVTALIVK